MSPRAETAGVRALVDYILPPEAPIVLLRESLIAEEGQAWMLTPAFDRNPIGVEFDPDELLAKFRSGVPVAELVVRD